MLYHRSISLALLLHITVLWILNCTCSAGRTMQRGQGSGRSRPQHQSGYWRQPRTSKKPNIVLILTDDQDVLLGSMSAMNKTKTVLGEYGANFINAFVTTPMCCPSRSSILTGQYVHNHHVYSNTDHCGSKEWREGPEGRSFATYLRSAEYRTGYFGKYLNNYNGTYIPPGWTEWVGLLQNSKYYNYTLNRNSRLYDHGFNYYRDYLPDLIANDSLAFFEMTRRLHPDNPIAMVMSFPSPHGPEDGAPQYQHLFEGNRLHRTETWNFTDNNDKHWLLRFPKPMTEKEIFFTDILQRKRLITLVSVDDAIAKLCTGLNNMGELDNTYIIFTSDHGYHLGQYALPKGKSLPYEFDVRVPFYMRGPKIPFGIEVPNIVLNIDLAPTLLDIAGVDIPPTMDGVSILKLFNSSNYRLSGKRKRRKWRYVGEPWRTSFLIEKTRSPEDLARLQKRLFQVRGEKDDRLREQCKLPELQSPCQPFQDKECVIDETSGEYKIRKCRRPPKIRCHCVRRAPANTASKGRRFRTRERPTVQATMTRDEKRQQRDFIREHVSQATPPFRFLRSRRDTPANDDALMFNLDDSIVENNILDDPKCQVYKNDTVMCDNEIFESRKAWLNHRKLISARVRLLRKHLEDLIEIKEFLRDTKPHPLEKSAVPETRPERTDKRGKPGKVCTCDNIEGFISEEDARELERLGDIYLENRGESEVGEGHRGTRYSRSISTFGETAGDGNLITLTTGLSRKQRKIQSKQDCSIEGMKCTFQDNDHWRVPPFWTMGDMCLCLNSVNNTYQCLRYLNETHNFLYCEYVTNFLEYFDMMPDQDPYQKRNAINDITDDYRRFMRDELAHLKNCSGASNCTSLQPTISHHRKPATFGKNSTRGRKPEASRPNEILSTPIVTTAPPVYDPVTKVATIKPATSLTEATSQSLQVATTVPFSTTSPSMTLDPTAKLTPDPTTALEIEAEVPVSSTTNKIPSTVATHDGSANKIPLTPSGASATEAGSSMEKFKVELEGSGTEVGANTESLNGQSSEIPTSGFSFVSTTHIPLIDEDLIDGSGNLESASRDDKVNNFDQIVDLEMTPTPLEAAKEIHKSLDPNTGQTNPSEENEKENQTVGNVGESLPFTTPELVLSTTKMTDKPFDPNEQSMIDPSHLSNHVKEDDKSETYSIQSEQENSQMFLYTTAASFVSMLRGETTSGIYTEVGDVTTGSRVNRESLMTTSWTPNQSPTDDHISSWSQLSTAALPPHHTQTDDHNTQEMHPTKFSMATLSPLDKATTSYFGGPEGSGDLQESNRQELTGTQVITDYHTAVTQISKSASKEYEGSGLLMTSFQDDQIVQAPTADEGSVYTTTAKYDDAMISAVTSGDSPVGLQSSAKLNGRVNLAAIVTTPKFGNTPVVKTIQDSLTGLKSNVAQDPLVQVLDEPSTADDTRKLVSMATGKKPQASDSSTQKRSVSSYIEVMEMHSRSGFHDDSAERELISNPSKSEGTMDDGSDRSRHDPKFVEILED